MMILWTDTTAAYATAGKAEGSWEATRVEIDSRRVQKGDLFIAIKGDHLDGHDYIGDALAKGAVAAVVSRVPAGIDKSHLLIVDDTLKAMEDLARSARKRSKAKIVGVTGSVGKTSAKEMLKLALSAHGQTHATTGNFNNHIGTPLNLANLPPQVPYAVFEMGMNHAGEIAKLTQMVRPLVAAITTVDAVHTEFFASVDEIAYAKAEIFQGVQPGGFAVLNRDNPYYGVLARRADEYESKTIITFGSHEKSDCRLIRYQPSVSGCEVEASILGKRIHYTMKAVGRHWAMTSLLTLAVIHALGLDVEKTAKALAEFGELDGRGRMVKFPVQGGEAVLIDDSYNASPASMRAAFAKTQEVWESTDRKGRKLAALGDMLELGDQTAELHSGLSQDIISSGFNKVFTSGVCMKLLYDALPSALRASHATKAAELLPLIKKELRAGDILLVKGSHGSKIYELAQALKEITPEPKDKATMTAEKLHAV